MEKKSERSEWQLNAEYPPSLFFRLYTLDETYMLSLYVKPIANSLGYIL